MTKPSFQEDSIRIRKRDGTIDPFEMPKLRNSIRNALRASGDPCGLDNAAANGLAEAIHEFLRRVNCGSPASSEHVLELVETVLTQTGHTEAGMAIRQHSQLRDRQRRWLIVASPHASNGRFIQHQWNKGRLVRHLRRQHLLDVPASRMIAGRVEQLVFNCGLKVVTSDLVREMANSELLAWGLLPGALAVKKTRNCRGSRKVKDNLDST